MRRNLAEIIRLNERVSSGRRINRPSDDPAGMGRAMDYRVAIDAGEQYLRNIDRAAGFLSYTESALSSASDALVRGKEIALQGANGTQSADSRSAMAKEVRQLEEHLAAIANGRFGNRYVFSGFMDDRAAFDAGHIYRGDGGAVNIPIDRGALLSINVTGSEAFGTTLPAEETAVISGGRIVHYIPSGGGVAVEIRASDDTTVLDSFRFDNVMQMTGLLAGALEGNDTARIGALVKPFDEAMGHVNDVRADIGGRLGRLEDQKNRISDASFVAREALSRTEDADIAETAAGIARADATLQALRASSARLLSQSLLDFLD